MMKIESLVFGSTIAMCVLIAMFVYFATSNYSLAAAVFFASFALLTYLSAIFIVLVQIRKKVCGD